MRRCTSSLVLGASLVLAGCGGSASSSSSSSARSATAGPSSISATSAATSNAQTSSAPTTTAHTSPPANAPDTNVRLPATFTIRAGGVLDSPEIAAPRHTDIALTVKSGDGRAHNFVLRAPHQYVVTVRAGAPAKLLLKGIPSGTYPIEVDHVGRGKLIVGAAPGP